VLTIAAPTHLPIDLISMIWTAERRGRLSERQRIVASETAEEMIATVSLHAPPSPRTLVPFAHRHQLTDRDASLAYLAHALQCPLLTSDAAQVRAAETSGIELVHL
jgi:predicted nucleic acid-binding protein